MRTDNGKTGRLFYFALRGLNKLLIRPHPVPSELLFAVAAEFTVVCSVQNFSELPLYAQKRRSATLRERTLNIGEERLMVEMYWRYNNGAGKAPLLFFIVVN